MQKFIVVCWHYAEVKLSHSRMFKCAHIFVADGNRASVQHSADSIKKVEDCIV